MAEGETLPTGNTLLIDAVETKTTIYLEADYNYYILRLNQGDGDSPYFTDIVSVKYEGISINQALDGNNKSFDSSVLPALFNLQTGLNSTGVIQAWQLVMPTFNASSGYDIDESGNVDFTNPGLGVMFVPSGLAFFHQQVQVILMII
ncbi:hypothetical protein HSX10_17695 [Winogradskyella undariae]|uniref:FKBP-type peptidyl-prolyl cis-trans isomerase n=1 Tax=Winogradskyella TaxID=286104 RepID=UPI00156B7142|nr:MULTISPECIES: hypothetical protein [Winogradskyella]NRR93411.1 hypothetical protein [Winogradskyella undariae]QXP79396.1 hypothetical protein H0I32_01770 [Winogradskyella sp. HaHa_3_26]